MITIVGKETGEEVEQTNVDNSFAIINNTLYTSEYMGYEEKDNNNNNKIYKLRKTDKYLIRVNGMRTREELKSEFKKIKDNDELHPHYQNGFTDCIKWVLGDE